MKAGMTSVCSSPCDPGGGETPQSARRARKADNPGARCDEAFIDLLVLSDGTILVHNLTPAMAEILSEINPSDPAFRPRVAAT